VKNGVKFLPFSPIPWKVESDGRQPPQPIIVWPLPHDVHVLAVLAVLAVLDVLAVLAVHAVLFLAVPYLDVHVLVAQLHGVP
jgi:hypothetical protein